MLIIHRLISHLGSGEFGSVDKGVWRSGPEMKEVAVKTLTDSANTVKFLQEAAIMAQFTHPNVLTLHGVVSKGDPVRLLCYTKWRVTNYLSTENDSSGIDAQWRLERGGH